MITVNILENGNAELLISGSDQQELIDLLDANERDHAAIFADLFESYSCNGSYTPIYDYGLTDAPAFTDEIHYPDECEPQPAPDAKIWWFPDYAIRDELRELAENGRVVFILAKDD